MEKHPSRKPNRIPGYDYAANGGYFVTICTDGRRKALGDVVGGDVHIAPRVQLSPWGRAVEKYLQGITGLDSYVIMPNHIHMVILLEVPADGSMWASTPTSSTQSVSQLVRSFKTLTSKALGRSIWQRSFYDHIIRTQREYEEIRQYIADNPAKWVEDDYYIR